MQSQRSSASDVIPPGCESLRADTNPIISCQEFVMKLARGVRRAEVPIETTLRHSGGIHDPRDADAIDTRLVKEARGSGPGTFAVLLHLLAIDLRYSTR